MPAKCHTCESTATIDNGSACAQCGCDRQDDESGTSIPLHIYDWLDLPAQDEGEKLAKEWLNKFVLPPGTKIKSGDSSWLAARSLTCEWRGQRYWCRGCSRMGDVWITKDPTGNTYYDHRVNVEDCSKWRIFMGRGNLQDPDEESPKRKEIK